MYTLHFLDPRSIIVIASLICGLMAVVLYLTRRHYPRHIGGLGYWAAAAALWFGSATLLGARNQGLPDLVVVLLPNAGLLLGTLLYYIGCCIFWGAPMRWRVWLLLFTLFTLGSAWWLYIEPSYVHRLILFTLCVLLLYVSNLRLLLARGGQDLSVRIVAFFLALQILVVLWRLVTIPSDMTADRLYEQTLAQMVYLGSYVVSHLFFTVGALLMATDRLASEMENLARNDPLTQLPNRRTLFERMEAEIARAQLSGRGPALLMLDLDHFKHINDTHGHQHGDKVLMHFAQTLQTQLRQTDILGRYGGEEFTAMLPETDMNTALQVAKRIHQATNNGHALACTVSIGLAAWAGPEDTLEALIARADGAVYEAKAQGRNRTCMA